MALFFSRLFGKPKHLSSKEALQRQQQVVDAGPPTLGEKLRASYVPNVWTQEWKKQRKGISDKYWADKQRLVVERRRAQQELKRSLERKRNKIESYYRLDELPPSDPRFATARKRAGDKIERIEQHASDSFREQWRERLRGLQRARNRQYRDVTKGLKRASREEQWEIGGDIWQKPAA